ncbi:DeoR/GlpR family DNA-binding transcription regulator [Pseudoleptotrichia goodfellowii]|uniref:Transcriptional regulator, DeoR family n=1 Tax=Pseudoleptotrichia goodfellowii F0264 TaxID=596323 RepID=D0GN66_9FUSO|nr:DeoR/GlpR family DNA-binding transcription regulator [Pseudoleptotrichia goodfellowii]EEY34422.1 transcriptional regulator, DeoR family [Pseudoleptotrichia goodfellowii F0264]
MFLDERLEKILEILSKEKKVKVNDLAHKFKVSEVIIRKDLKRLEIEGKLRRTHGGAILLKELVHTIALEDRIINRTKQKEKIAEKIISHIKEKEVIFFDVSSINYMVAERLSKIDKSLKIITNMPSIAALFNKNSQIEIIIAGGDYHKEIGGIIGSEAINNISRYNADKAFIGCAGIDIDTGRVMNFDANDGNTKRKIMDISGQNFLVTESKKINETGSFNFSNLKEFTGIITEKNKLEYSNDIRKKLSEDDTDIL